MTAITAEQVAGALRASNWIYAKTMPQWPHEYTLRKHWTQEIPFEAVVQYIRDHGYRERFKPSRSIFTRFVVGDHKYWSMGEPLEKTILINRALLDDPFSERID